MNPHLSPGRSRPKGMRACCQAALLLAVQMSLAGSQLLHAQPFKYQGSILDPGIAADLNATIQSLGLTNVSYQDYQRTGNWDYTILPKQSPETNGVPVTTNDTQLGFILYSRPITELVFPYSKPQSRATNVVISASLGEYKPSSVCIWNLGGTATFQLSAGPLTNLATGEQIPASNIQFRATTMLPLLKPDSGLYFQYPSALELRNSMTISNGLSGQFWMTVYVPTSTTSGTYSSAMTVTRAGSTALSLPVTLTVLPFALDEANADLSMCFLIENYTNMHPENLDLYMGDMKAHGLNSLWTWPLGNVFLISTNLNANFTQRCTSSYLGSSSFAHSFQETMNAYLRAGFMRPWIYGSLDALLTILANSGRTDPNDPSTALPYLLSYTSQLRAFLSQSNYVGSDLLLLDEPGVNYSSRLPFVQQLYQGFHAQLPAQGLLLDCLPWTNEDSVLAPTLDTILYGDASSARKTYCDQNSLKFGNYNAGSGGKNPEIDRFTYGAWPVIAGLRSVANWVYAWRYDSSSPPGNRYVFPASDGPVPTLAWEGVREGVVDQKYLLTFQRLANELSQSARSDIRTTVSNLQAQVNQLLSPMPVNRADRNDFLESYPQSGFDNLRQVLATNIVTLLQLYKPTDNLNLIYSDNFTGPSSSALSGKTTTTGLGVWTAGGINADGSFTGSGQAVLPVTISSGCVYDITATIAQTSNNWAGITFSPTPQPIWAAFGSGFFGTMLDNGELYPGSTVPNLGSGNYDIRLDTRSAHWTITYFFNGNQVGSYTWSGNNPSIAYVGLVSYNNSGPSVGKFSSFSLTRVGSAALIYSDNFTGSSANSLSGMTTTTGGGTWMGSSSDAIKADGRFAGTGQKVLPIIISNGVVYELKATITQTSNNWAGITFSPNANPIWAAFSSPFYGTLLSEGHYYSAGAAGYLGSSLGSGDYKIVLDTTQPNWSVTYFFNGVQKAVNTWTAGNPSIAYVGLVTYNNSGTSVGKFSNFVVRQITSVPPTITFSVTGSTLALSWPTDHLGWTLQQQINALSTNWVDVPGSTTVTSTNVTVNPSAPAVFYRLKL